MKTKKESKFFTIMEYEEEQIYLQGKHKQGWKLTKAKGTGTYYFEECESEDVVYQLDYNQEGLANKEEYIKMFTDCGWEYIMDFWGYSYFRKPVSEMNGREEIFCNDSSRLEMMERIFKGRFVPLLIGLCIIFVITCIFSFSSGGNIGFVIFPGIIVLIYLKIFIQFCIKYSRYKKNTGN